MLAYTPRGAVNRHRSANRLVSDEENDGAAQGKGGRVGRRSGHRTPRLLGHAEQRREVRYERSGRESGARLRVVTGRLVDRKIRAARLAIVIGHSLAVAGQLGRMAGVVAVRSVPIESASLCSAHPAPWQALALHLQLSLSCRTRAGAVRSSPPRKTMTVGRKEEAWASFTTRSLQS